MGSRIYFSFVLTGVYQQGPPATAAPGPVRRFAVRALVTGGASGIPWVSLLLARESLGAVDAVVSRPHHCRPTLASATFCACPIGARRMPSTCDADLSVKAGCLLVAALGHCT